MTIQNLLQQCRKKSHSKVLRFWVVLAAVALLLVLACRNYDWDALGRYKGDNISSLHYVRGRVVEVLRDDTKPDQLDPARSMGTQELRILLLEGANKGTEVTIANYLTRTQNVRLRQGETAIICEDLPDSADAYYTVYNYDRAPVLVLILAVFAAAVVAIGGWKGVRTLLGLGFTGAMIAWLILPGIYHGCRPCRLRWRRWLCAPWSACCCSTRPAPKHGRPCFPLWRAWRWREVCSTCSARCCTFPA